MQKRRQRGQAGASSAKWDRLGHGGEEPSEQGKMSHAEPGTAWGRGQRQRAKRGRGRAPSVTRRARSFATRAPKPLCQQLCPQPRGGCPGGRGPGAPLARTTLLAAAPGRHRSPCQALSGVSSQQGMLPLPSLSWPTAITVFKRRLCSAPTQRSPAPWAHGTTAPRERRGGTASPTEEPHRNPEAEARVASRRKSPEALADGLARGKAAARSRGCVGSGNPEQDLGRRRAGSCPVQAAGADRGRAGGAGHCTHGEMARRSILRRLIFS